MKHNIKVMLETKDGREQITENKHLKIRERIMKWLFGDFCEVIVLNPSKKLTRFKLKK